MIYITFDIDWVPDKILDDSINILEQAGIEATFFATHTSPSISKLLQSKHEVGIHPNLMPNFNGQGINYKETIDCLINSFPDAVGVRFHSLGYSAPVLDYCYQKGLVYDSSIYLPNQITPYKEYTGIYRIPFKYCDLQFAVDHSDFEINLEIYNPDLPLVFIFHPIHVFLNTESVARYEAAKKFYQNPKELQPFINTTSTPGARDLLKSLVNLKDKYKFRTLKNLIK